MGPGRTGDHSFIAVEILVVLASEPLQRSEPHPCGYLTPAGTEVALLGLGRTTQTPPASVAGVIAYRPNCDRCRACFHARFRATRSRRRAGGSRKPTALFPKQQALPALRGEPPFRQVDRDDREQVTVHTRLIEFRDNGALVMVSVIDEAPDGLSSVYTFFDPDIPGASLGTYSILWQIEQCRRASLPYVYLGYWIKESRKMSYKARFRPIEGFVDGRWRRLDAD